MKTSGKSWAGGGVSRRASPEARRCATGQRTRSWPSCRWSPRLHASSCRGAEVPSGVRFLPCELGLAPSPGVGRSAVPRPDTRFVKPVSIARVWEAPRPPRVSVLHTEVVREQLHAERRRESPQATQKEKQAARRCPRALRPPRSRVVRHRVRVRDAEQRLPLGPMSGRKALGALTSRQRARTLPPTPCRDACPRRGRPHAAPRRDTCFGRVTQEAHGEREGQA